MKDLLLNVSGITETKLFMLDTFITLAKKHNPKVIKLEQLEAIRELFVKEAKKGEMDNVFTKMEEEA